MANQQKMPFEIGDILRGEDYPYASTLPIVLYYRVLDVYPEDNTILIRQLKTQTTFDKYGGETVKLFRDEFKENSDEEEKEIHYHKSYGPFVRVKFGVPLYFYE